MSYTKKDKRLIIVQAVRGHIRYSLKKDPKIMSSKEFSEAADDFLGNLCERGNWMREYYIDANDVEWKKVLSIFNMWKKEAMRYLP